MLHQNFILKIVKVSILKHEKILSIGLKNMNKKCFFYIHNNFITKIKRLIDITGHDLLDIDTIHLFTPNFKVFSV